MPVATTHHNGITAILAVLLAAFLSPPTERPPADIRPEVRIEAHLDDSPSARQFAAMLPLRLTLRDGMGQAKIARLPAPIDVIGASHVTKPETATIYYWPPSAAIGIYYDDIGQSLPAPGMVRLGTVESGLDDLRMTNCCVARVIATYRSTAPSMPVP
jgi:hypothetical protein